MRQGTERVYMMDYDRTVNQVFNGAESAFSIVIDIYRDLQRIPVYAPVSELADEQDLGSCVLCTCGFKSRLAQLRNHEMMSS